MWVLIRSLSHSRWCVVSSSHLLTQQRAEEAHSTPTVARNISSRGMNVDKVEWKIILSMTERKLTHSSSVSVLCEVKDRSDIELSLGLFCLHCFEIVYMVLHESTRRNLHDRRRIRQAWYTVVTFRTHFYFIFDERDLHIVHVLPQLNSIFFWDPMRFLW